MSACLRAFLPVAALLAGCAHAVAAAEDARLAGSSRGARNGWITVRLQGAPSAVGYQHGTLLAAEIEDAVAVAKLSLTHDGKRDWAFFRKAAETVFWPRVDAEYREEMQGIADGAAAAGGEVSTSGTWSPSTRASSSATTRPPSTRTAAPARPTSAAPSWPPAATPATAGRSSRTTTGPGTSKAPAGTSSSTSGPAAGHRILMDGMPGLIHSGDDFGVNSAGLVITETTITGFQGFDPAGIPEFARARKAMQYAASIDDFDRIMRKGNNGGYANAWLVADTNTGEIARLELGLKNVTLERTKDGYFAGTNFPVSPKLAAEETKFKLDDPSLSANARRVRADEILKASEGKIDVALAKGYLSDHHDSYEKKDERPERAQPLRPRGPLPARDGRLVRRLGPGGDGAVEGRRRRDGEADVPGSGDGPPVRHGLPGRAAPREDPGLRLGEAADARPRRLPWTLFEAP